MPSKGQSLPVRIERIGPEQLARLRHEVLWPTIPIEEQLLPYDYLSTTKHYGAFLIDADSISSHVEKRHLRPSDASSITAQSHLAEPIGQLTITLEPYSKPERLAAEYQRSDLTHYQLHKFAVMGTLQGYGIGRRLVETALRDLHDTAGAGNTLLHLDSRKDQRGLYEKLGFQCLDEDIFIKRGPTGTGPPTEYVRMGMVLPSTAGTETLAL